MTIIKLLLPDKRQTPIRRKMLQKKILIVVESHKTFYMSGKTLSGLAYLAGPTVEPAWGLDESENTANSEGISRSLL